MTMAAQIKAANNFQLSAKPQVVAVQTAESPVRATDNGPAIHGWVQSHEAKKSRQGRQKMCKLKRRNIS